MHQKITYCLKNTNYIWPNSLIIITNWSIFKQMIVLFYNAIYSFMNKCVSKLTVKKYNGPPMNNKYLTKLWNLKNMYYKKYTKFGLLSDFHKFNYSCIRVPRN